MLSPKEQELIKVQLVLLALKNASVALYPSMLDRLLLQCINRNEKCHKADLRKDWWLIQGAGWQGHDLDSLFKKCVNAGWQFQPKILVWM